METDASGTKEIPQTLEDALQPVPGSSQSKIKIEETDKKTPESSAKDAVQLSSGPPPAEPDSSTSIKKQDSEANIVQLTTTSVVRQAKSPQAKALQETTEPKKKDNAKIPEEPHTSGRSSRALNIRSEEICEVSSSSGSDESIDHDKAAKVTLKQQITYPENLPSSSIKVLSIQPTESLKISADSSDDVDITGSETSETSDILVVPSSAAATGTAETGSVTDSSISETQQEHSDLEESSEDESELHINLDTVVRDSEVATTSITSEESALKSTEYGDNPLVLDMSESSLDSHGKSALPAT